MVRLRRGAGYWPRSTGDHGFGASSPRRMTSRDAILPLNDRPPPEKSHYSTSRQMREYPHNLTAISAETPLPAQPPGSCGGTETLCRHPPGGQNPKPIQLYIEIL